MKTITHLTTVACSQAFLIASFSVSLSADTVTYTSDPLPAFTTKDNYVFNTAGSVDLPRFDTLGGTFVLQRAHVQLSYSYNLTYNVTNNTQAFAFGLIRRTWQFDGTSPAGVMFGPLYSGGSGGPNLPPGATQPNLQSHSPNDLKTYNGSSAQPFTGTGTCTLDATVGLVMEVVNPAAISSVYVSGSTQPPVYSIEYTYKCDGDTNGDHVINVADLLDVIGTWGFVGFCSPFACPTDLDPSPTGNGQVNVADLLRVISHWGDCPDGP